MKKIYFILINMMILNSAFAVIDPNYWTGNGGNNFWHNPDNWTEGVPEYADHVYIGSGVFGSGAVIIQSDSTAFAGTVYIYNNRQLTIEQNATLSIDGSSIQKAGIEFNGTIYNYGTVNIQNTYSHGLLIVGGPTPLDGKRVTSDISSREVSYDNPFFNHGTLNILNGISGDGIYNLYGNFINEPCGVLNINYKINNKSGFVNNSIINQNYSGNNANSGGLTNNSRIEDLYNSFDGVSITNNGYIVSPLTGLFEVNVPVSPVLKGDGTGVSITSDAFYIDSLLTISAGPFVKATNTWTPNTAADGLDRFFMVLDDGEGCPDTMEINLSSAVPIQLLSFKAGLENNQMNLFWQTASETNNQGFDIQKSRDGGSWQTIGFVKGNGTSRDIIEYNYIDKNPYNGINYYRLKQIDFDGVFEYSDVVSVDYQNGDKNDFYFYPNPTEGIIHFSSEKRGVIRIIDKIGNTIYNNVPNNNTIDINGYPNGIYTLLYEVDGRAESYKVVVMKN